MGDEAKATDIGGLLKDGFLTSLVLYYSILYPPVSSGMTYGFRCNHKHFGHLSSSFLQSTALLSPSLSLSFSLLSCILIGKVGTEAAAVSSYYYSCLFLGKTFYTYFQTLL